LVSSGIILEESAICRSSLSRIAEQADFQNVLCGQYDNSTDDYCPGKKRRLSIG